MIYRFTNFIKLLGFAKSIVIGSYNQSTQINVMKNKMINSTKVNVKLPQGTIVGLQETLPNGNPYYAYKGIPYAEPPLGKYRFKAPVEMKKFPEPILDCTTERSVCFHKDTISNNMIGSEDCLFLNIYTPKHLENSYGDHQKLPVMIWIHGGAFMAGSGNSDYYSPEYMVQENVIIVTINYRLGPFGFLCLPTMGIPGNSGMKDQLMAMKWVKEHISEFGGDSSNVTLFGESAGGASVHLHMMSESSKDYFHKAICQSGCGTMDWVLGKSLIEKTKKLAAMMGCTATDDKGIFDFLQSRTDPNEFYKYLFKILPPDEKRRGLPIAFRPSVEENLPGAFLTRPPFDILNETDSLQKPIMMGYNSCEGMVMLMDGVNKIGELDKDLARMIPRTLNIDPNNPACLELAENVRRFYFNGNEVTKRTLNELSHLHTDYHFVIDAHIAAEIHARKQHRSPLYFYRFSFDGDLNLFKKLLYMKLLFENQLKGVCHGDEMFYLFNLKLLDIRPEIGSPSANMVETMCRMWTNFAKYSNPTPPNDDSLPFKWKPIECVKDDNPFSLDYLEIGDEIAMKRNPDRERIDFWRDLYGEWNKSFLKPKL